MNTTAKQKEYKTIGDVAKILSLEQHVVRFWTSTFALYVKPLRKAGNRRYYSKNDINVLIFIKEQLYSRGMSIKGVQLLLSEKKHKYQDNKLERDPNSILFVDHNKRVDKIIDNINNIVFAIDNFLNKH